MRLRSFAVAFLASAGLGLMGGAAAHAGIDDDQYVLSPTVTITDNSETEVVASSEFTQSLTGD
ncbi:hypothetical protein SAMN02982929_01699 [Saccharopolyspora kobensis]|uniref:Uncharacterized protein n=1 Tax=Saccharopolyspora kobensis TaxID=146035 RepID=A0A1H5Y0V5_9PSEU|nr:hypothetical protein [Saccharopolyspora kobensis]SEG17166.1 hypothetical protein SAMN02982929_01699 [Saccharopolyspora kobensis]SFF09902.1 hypothetical protein SAMN05216506_11943 [Saccharopolyspora kobensis]